MRLDASGPPGGGPASGAADGGRPRRTGLGPRSSPDGGGQPVHDLLGSFGVVAIQGAPDEDALDGLGHVQPGAPSGVYKGITPWAHSQSTRSGVLVAGSGCPR